MQILFLISFVLVIFEMWEIKGELQTISSSVASGHTLSTSTIEHALDTIEDTLSTIRSDVSIVASHSNGISIDSIENTLSTIESNLDIWIKPALEDIKRELGDITNSLNGIEANTSRDA